MSKNHEKDFTRRDVMKFGAAASAAAMVVSQGSLAGAQEAGPSIRKSPSASRPNARFIVDVHAHGGAPAGMIEIGKEVNSPEDWGAIRTKDPERFAKAMGGEQIDNTDGLIGTMDQYGVTHALLQMTPGKGSTNDAIAAMVRKHKGRFFPIYRPDFMMGDIGAGDMTKDPDDAVFARNSERFVNDIESRFPEWGMIGVGEVIPGGMVTSAVDPVEITRDMSPIMEALGKRNLPIQFPTGYTGWQGGLHYIWDPIWVDEVAAIFPKVPIVLVKMGRGFRTSFDTCLVVAVRNANVYLEMTDAPSEHIREAVEKVGAHRVMFGTDLSVVSTNYCYELGFRDLNGANLTAEQVEWICWRTANEVYQLGLEG